MTEEALEQALAEREERRRRAGRASGGEMEQVTLRLDQDVLGRFRQDGPGWQLRLNATLRKAVGL